MSGKIQRAEVQKLVERLRRESGALTVVAIRVDDVSYSADPAISPRDFAETVSAELPNIVQHLGEDRKSTQPSGRTR